MYVFVPKQKPVFVLKTNSMRRHADFHIQTDDDITSSNGMSLSSTLRTPASVRRAMSSFSENIQTGTAKVFDVSHEAAGSFHGVAEVTKSALNRAVDPVITAGV